MPSIMVNYGQSSASKVLLDMAFINDDLNISGYYGCRWTITSSGTYK